GAGLLPDGRRRLGDPGPRLRADLREGDRPGARAGRALARGARGRRARDGSLNQRLCRNVQIPLVAVDWSPSWGILRSLLPAVRFGALAGPIDGALGTSHEF